jgi:hypothetical protein
MTPFSLTYSKKRKAGPHLHAVGGLSDKERKIELEVVGRAVVYVTTSNAR